MAISTGHSDSVRALRTGVSFIAICAFAAATPALAQTAGPPAPPAADTSQPDQADTVANSTNPSAPTDKNAIVVTGIRPSLRSAQNQNRTVKFTVDAYPEELFTGKIYQIRKNSTTTQNVVTYPVVIEAPNPELKLLPGMTANISFQIEAKQDVLRVPTSALRYFPLPASVRPEDRHYLEGTTTSEDENAPRLSAGEKATLARNRQKRIVWIQEEQLLRAVPPGRVEMENLRMRMHARIRPAAALDAKPSAEDAFQPYLDQVLHRVAALLALPAVKRPAVIGDDTLPTLRLFFDHGFHG